MTHQNPIIHAIVNSSVRGGSLDLLSLRRILNNPTVHLASGVRDPVGGPVGGGLGLEVVGHLGIELVGRLGLAPTGVAAATDPRTTTTAVAARIGGVLGDGRRSRLGLGLTAD